MRQTSYTVVRDNTLLWIGLGLAAIALLGTGGYVATQAWLQSENGKKWAQYLSDAEDYYGIPRGLLSRIAYQESHFRSDIIDGTKTSPVGALGMMQLMPRYFATVQRPVPFSESDTQDQITEAANYLKSLYTQFGDWYHAVAAYNDGPANIRAVIAGNKTLPQETVDYVSAVFADVPVSA